MSKFYVGQRVRIRRSYTWPELDGTEATIAGAVDLVDDETGIRMEWIVAPDAWGGMVAPTRNQFGNTGFGASSAQLEPLQPERNQTIEWSECVWKPEHMRAEA